MLNGWVHQDFCSNKNSSTINRLLHSTYSTYIGHGDQCTYIGHGDQCTYIGHGDQCTYIGHGDQCKPKVLPLGHPFKLFNEFFLRLLLLQDWWKIQNTNTFPDKVLFRNRIFIQRCRSFCCGFVCWERLC